MRQVEEAIQKFQRVAAQLHQLQIDDEPNPWEILRQMRRICDEELVNHLSRFIKISNEMNMFGSFENIEKITPKIIIDETPTKIIVYCKIAGLDYQNVKTSVIDKNQLNIQGRVYESSLADHPTAKEPPLGNFVRQIELPHSVSSDIMKTIYHEDVLEIHLSKETEKGRKLQSGINTG
ncbi:Hsp20 family protein [Brevibacillus ruminantium]|uniref:Hsp20 family protein n=1 Tax=Brevibacillus ruminantium TaxID=2950604 RepID=A0ABY4WGH8_9BACL|nr:Hsp20 family protein [Brevibacillus ruminantium]USG66138.1 Hsp20 family protein [Brevibacillus ruminantium]